MKLKRRQFFGRCDNFLIFSRFFLELRSKGLYPSSEQEKENRRLAFTFFTKCGRATTAKNCTKKCVARALLCRRYTTTTSCKYRVL